MIDINLTGPFLVMKASLPHTDSERLSCIINISSLGGFPVRLRAWLLLIQRPRFADQAAALDYGRFKVRCNAVCPGATRTEMLEEALTPLAESLKTGVDDIFARISSNVPLRRVAAPDEVTGVCSFLASDDSAFMTGSVLLLDGGAAIVDVAGAALSGVGVNWGVS